MSEPRPEQINVDLFGVDGPKESPGRMEDRQCDLCNHWFTIFQVHQYGEDRDDVCHRCAHKVVVSELKWANLLRKLKG